MNTRGSPNLTQWPQVISVAIETDWPELHYTPHRAAGQRGIPSWEESKKGSLESIRLIDSKVQPHLVVTALTCSFSNHQYICSWYQWHFCLCMHIILFTSFYIHVHIPPRLCIWCLIVARALPEGIQGNKLDNALHHRLIESSQSMGWVTGAVALATCYTIMCTLSSHCHPHYF